MAEAGVTIRMSGGSSYTVLLIRSHRILPPRGTQVSGRSRNTGDLNRACITVVNPNDDVNYTFLAWRLEKHVVGFFSPDYDGDQSSTVCVSIFAILTDLLLTRLRLI